MNNNLYISGACIGLSLLFLSSNFVGGFLVGIYISSKYDLKKDIQYIEEQIISIIKDREPKEKKTTIYQLLYGT